MSVRSATAAACLVTLVAGSASAQEFRDHDERDWAGMRRDLYYLMGWQVVATAIIYQAPFEVSNWNEAEKENLGFEQWRDNITDVVWDEDHWAVNYVTHPYWGAGYYIRGRERGFSRKESFWIAALYSTVYEFGVESFLEQPSIQDIIVTPTLGTAVGIWFEKVRTRIRNQPEPLKLRHRFVLGMTDPLGALNRGVDRVFGLDDSDDSRLVLGFRPIYSAAPPRFSEWHRPARRLDRSIDGFQITFHYQW